MSGRMAVVIAVVCQTGSVAGAEDAASGPRDEPDPRRRVAVLEVRSGSAELAGMGTRVAALLRRRTSLDVVDGVEARRRDATFDEVLSRCDGQAGCVARLGRTLGAGDVLLVGVAEFGDVILTLQRIRVDRGMVTARVAEALARGEPPDDDALFGYLARVLPPSDFRRYGMLRIAADVVGASVTVGGRRRGVTPMAPLRVAAPARYDIAVAKRGFADFRASVAVPPEADVLVRAELTRLSGRAWYTRWWVLAAAGAVAAGAVTAAVLVTRDPGDELPVRIEPF